MPDVAEMLAAAGERVRTPAVVVLGGSRQVARLVERLPPGEAVCYQMELHRAAQVRHELAAAGLSARVECLPDLWDLPTGFATAVLPVAERGERELKIDLVDQSFQVLKQYGQLVVLSPYRSDDFFPPLLKKVFGKVASLPSAGGSVFAARRERDRPRRRHEVTVQARVGDGEPVRFVSRPGVFSYGRFDEGARALLEVAQINDGDRVLDLGCGPGAVGLLAARRAGPAGHVTFVDSNVRATQLAELNARANGLTDFAVVATGRLEGVAPAQFDVILTNPPYFAQDVIARLFMERGTALLKPGGRFYLVTRQPNAVEEQIVHLFGEVEVVPQRAYAVFVASQPLPAAARGARRDDY
jgi:23S rRNA (guanine1835-N2)-methyltransferase